MRLVDRQRDEIAKRYARGESGWKLAREFGLRPQSVYELAKRRGHVPRVLEPWASKVARLKAAGVITGVIPRFSAPRMGS